MPFHQYSASASCIYPQHDRIIHQAANNWRQTQSYPSPPSWQRVLQSPIQPLRTLPPPFHRQSPPVNQPRRNAHARPQALAPAWTPPRRSLQFSPMIEPVTPVHERSWTAHSSPFDDRYTLSPVGPSTPPPQTPTEMEDVMQTHLIPKLPSTPEWFPMQLAPETVHTPPITPIISRNLSSPFDSPFSRTEFIEHNSESPEPHLFSDIPPLSSNKFSTPPRIPLDLSKPRDAMYTIHKKEMEALLLRQPVSATPLCDITKEGQICHLRRYERAGVFVRSTVKFDKAFKHLSNLRENLQHLIIGLKSIPTVFTVDQVTDSSVVSLLQSLPNLQEVRLHGFTQLTKQSFDAALIYCPKLRVLAITGTRVPNAESRKLVYSNGRPQRAGGTGSFELDTLASLMPNGGPIRSVALIGQFLRFIDISFQDLDPNLAKLITKQRAGDFVIMRELQNTTERYANGVLQVSDPIDGNRLQGLQRQINPVASTVGWHAPA